MPVAVTVAATPGPEQEAREAAALVEPFDWWRPALLVVAVCWLMADAQTESVNIADRLGAITNTAVLRAASALRAKPLLFLARPAQLTLQMYPDRSSLQKRRACASAQSQAKLFPQIPRATPM